MCLMPLSTIFLLYCGGQFYWWRKPKYVEQPPTCCINIVESKYQLLIHWRSNYQERKDWHPINSFNPGPCAYAWPKPVPELWPSLFKLSFVLLILVELWPSLLKPFFIMLYLMIISLSTIFRYQMATQKEKKLKKRNKWLQWPGW